MKNVLEEADELTSVDRQGDYGHPIDNFSQTAMIWTALLRDKLKEGVELDATDVPLLMVGVKLSRECNKHKRDNLVDTAGYIRTLEMVHEKLEEREKA